MDVDAERARTEIADLERLSREALADVRRAVDGYRELTLPGEIARARARALRGGRDQRRAADSTDEVPGELRELFAWTIREGVTNVIRHSGAPAARCGSARTRSRCSTTGARRPRARRPGGHGLVGLRERAARLGATSRPTPAPRRLRAARGASPAGEAR